MQVVYRSGFNPTENKIKFHVIFCDLRVIDFNNPFFSPSFEREGKEFLNE